MMEQDLVIWGSAIAMAVLTQMAKWLQKKYTPWVTPSLLAFVLCLILGVVYAILVSTGTYEEVRNFTLLVFGGATAVYRFGKWGSDKLK